MPVNFYPPKPIELLEQYITKEDGSPLNGEIDVYKKIHEAFNKSTLDWHVWHDLRLPFHSNSWNPRRKTNAQIDFLILCQEGILIIEVKGGSISFKNNEFYYGNNHEQKINEEPFSQAQGYKYTIKENILNNRKDVFLCHSVAFPHSQKNFETHITESEVLWTALNSNKYDGCFEKFVLSVFKYSKNKHKIQNRAFGKLDKKEVEKIKNYLSPIVADINRYYNQNTTEWLNVNNLEILEGLEKNDRIMVEGGPGTGKTTIAKAFIDKQIARKGLYLCWNNLLMHYVRHKLNERKNSELCEVTTLTRFIKKLDSQINVEGLLSSDENSFYETIKKTIETLKANNELPHYDYIVIDEAQDTFDRGIDLLVNNLVGTNYNGLSNGRCLLLYDIEQGYFPEGRNMMEMAELFSTYYSHYKLHEVKRSSQNPYIKKIASRLFDENIDIAKVFENWNHEKEVGIFYYNSLEEIKGHISRNILQSMRNKESSLKGSDCVVLVESRLLRSDRKDQGMDYHLTIKDVEPVNENNINDSSNILRYTSILKYKGLEKCNVFLVINNPSHLNKYELYIGITRAISKLEILILNE